MTSTHSHVGVKRSFSSERRKEANLLETEAGEQALMEWKRCALGTASDWSENKTGKSNYSSQVTVLSASAIH